MGDQDAKLRFSRKLIYASGLAFCLSCQLSPPNATHQGLFGDLEDESSGPFIGRAKSFAQTPPMEFLAAFVDSFVTNQPKRKKIADAIFGSYNWWLHTINDVSAREELESLDFSAAKDCTAFQEVRRQAKNFAKGLELLFFNRDHDEEKDPIAQVVMQYIGF